MKSRGFFLALVSLFFAPHPALGQKVFYIAAVVADDSFTPAFEGLKRKMAALGYVERWTRFSKERNRKTCRSSNP